MMVFRVSLRWALAAMCTLVVLTTLYWMQCTPLPARRVTSELLNQLKINSKENNDYSNEVLQEQKDRQLVEKDDLPNNLECWINGEYNAQCLEYNNQVYMPFVWVRNYFEVYGKLSNVEGAKRFDFSHSYGKVYRPKKKYDPTGTFTTFENYNVEVRERVKCISGIEGVPISTQWDPKGFFYPTQIAQYGLAHYSKNITEPEPRRHLIDDGETIKAEWITTKDASVSRVYNPTKHSNVLNFKTLPGSEVFLDLNITDDFVLSLDLMLKPNASMTLVLQSKEWEREKFYLHYVTTNDMIYAQRRQHVYHGVGAVEGWRRITRDLAIDLQKGAALLEMPKIKQPRNKYKITRLIFNGTGSVDNVTLSTSDHMASVWAAADWLVRNQRTRTGGWPVPARRRIAAGIAELPPGWHSAMSQGHAISLLARAFHQSGEQRYLEAAKRALRVLESPSTAGGVRAMWMDRYVWYEEYPTKPPLFVLNGFIYTLLGLYDLYTIEGENSISRAKKLFDDGMTSLKTLLPLFDTGTGSFYDLRHFTLGVSPNRARWDYHATHVNQLYLLAGLDNDPILLKTAERWEEYMKGKWAAHN